MKLLEECKQAKRIGISGHIRPDGDCIGSCMGLYLYLKKVRPDADIHIFLEKPADIFSCIRGVEEIDSDYGKQEKFDVFFCLDTASDRLGQAEEYFCTADKKINIDHHVSNSGCGDVNYVIPEASSTSELIYNLIDGEQLDEEIAKMAAAYQMEADKLKGYMSDRDKDQMKEDIAVQEAVDFLVAEAKLV